MLLIAFVLALQTPVRPDPETLRPGLLLRLRAGDAEVVRVDPKPALATGLDSPHPRLPPGPFEAVWSGLIQILDPEALVFDADLAGSLSVQLGGRTVLHATSDGGRVRGDVRLDPAVGFHPLRVEFRSTPGVPARLQLGWEGAAFSREPLPAFRLRHSADELPSDARRAARGRDLVGTLGCARCHVSAFPGVDDPPPGPSLADAAGRIDPGWMRRHLEAPPGRMPRLFAEGPEGERERRQVAAVLAGLRAWTPPTGDVRRGRLHFLTVGCVACHLVPDIDPDEQKELGRRPFTDLAARWPADRIAKFLLDPHTRYPDGRMPNLRLEAAQARDLAAYLLSGATVAHEDAGPEVGGRDLLASKRCGACHPGVEGPAAFDVPVRAPSAVCSGPRFALSDVDRQAIETYAAIAAAERHPSPPETRRRMLARLGCERCHSRDDSRSPPLEEASSTLGGAFLQAVPFLRTPRLSYAHAKFAPEHLKAALRDGVKGDRHDRFTFRMPGFGDRADEIARALAEADGDPWPLPPADPAAAADPTLAPLGPSLIGFEGYACVSCHLWKGQRLSEADPGAVGPELTGVTRRIRRPWFDRWLEDPARIHPGTPMPQVFKKGKPATLGSLLDGDAARQREALWAYFALGKAAPSPRPMPPLAIDAPASGPPLAALIPVTMPDKAVVDSLCVLFPSHDLLVIDLDAGRPRGVFTGARLLRTVKGRLRTFAVSGTDAEAPKTSLPGGYAGHDVLPDGVRVRSSDSWEIWRVEGRSLRRATPEGETVHALPAAEAPPPPEPVALPDPGRPEGPPERPGYRATEMPRPRTPAGEDLVMPGAIACDPVDGRVFVASMKRGEIFVLKPGGTPVFEDYARGLFQEAYSMKAEEGVLYVLHRRHLTAVRDTDGDGRADRFDQEARLPQAAGEVYDYAYGLVRDRGGAFLASFAPHGNRKIPGSGSLVRLGKEGAAGELAWGFRNPIGWCSDPAGDIYFTDNQGEWVATNKLCHVAPGRFYGYPNSEQRHHDLKPHARTAVWVPYAWARSINGVTCDTTGGKFGPFDGQFFLAELMYGGAIVRAQVEHVKGQAQGACFPFWGRGLLGPVTLAFDPKGRLWVGSITEPGWMAQPDRGGVFRIDFTGDVPFEIRSIHVRPRGFRLVFTRPVDATAASAVASYAVDHHRYEYTGAYGSPELDRTTAQVQAVVLSADGLSAELTLPPLVKDRVYMISAPGVRSSRGEALVHPTGAYTLHEIPD